MAKKQFVIWNVNETEYKLKLTSRAIEEIETALGEGALLNYMIGMSKQNFIPMKAIISILHGAMKGFNHGIKREDVYKLYDAYELEGNTQIDVIQEIIIPTLEVSGLFTMDSEEEVITA